MDIRGKYPLVTPLCPSAVPVTQTTPQCAEKPVQNCIKDRSLAHSLFFPSSLPLPVSGMLCSRLAANHPSVNPTTDPSGLAGGSPLVTLIEVVFAKGTLLMGLGSSSPVVDEITLHAPD